MTTLIALKNNFGTFIGADTQPTMDNFRIPAKVSKILRVDNVLIAIAGNAGVAQNSVKKLKRIIDEIREEDKSNISGNANGFSKILAEIMFNLSTKEERIETSSFLVSDNKKIFYVDQAGALMEVKNFISIGSGGQFAMGVLTNSYKKDLNERKVLKLITSALKSANYSDINTNNIFEIFKIEKSGKIKKLK
jgi:20S proteasome alpha/beta subunit